MAIAYQYYLLGMLITELFHLQLPYIMEYIVNKIVTWELEGR